MFSKIINKPYKEKTFPSHHMQTLVKTDTS